MSQQTKKLTNINLSEIKQFLGSALIATDINDAAWQVGIAPPITTITFTSINGITSICTGESITKNNNGQFMKVEVIQ